MLPPTKRSASPRSSWRGRAAARCILGACSAFLIAGCGKSAAAKLVDESMAHMQAAERMMAEANGKLEPLIDAVGQYRLKHHADFRRLRKDGESAMASLSASEREKLATRARLDAQQWMDKIEAHSKEFERPTIALRVIRPLLIAATPKPTPSGPKSLLPKVPPLPMAGTPTGAGPLGGHGHGHGRRIPRPRAPAHVH